MTVGELNAQLSEILDTLSTIRSNLGQVIAENAAAAAAPEPSPRIEVDSAELPRGFFKRATIDGLSCFIKKYLFFSRARSFQSFAYAKSD